MFSKFKQPANVSICNVVQPSEHWNYSKNLKDGQLYLGPFPWQRLTTRANSRTFFPQQAKQLAELIAHFGWDVTSEIIAMIWEVETENQIKEILSQAEPNKNSEEIEKFFKDSPKIFTLSFIAGSHRFQALTELKKQGNTRIPTLIQVRALSMMDDLAFHFLSERSNDFTHCVQQQVLIDRINQVHKLWQHLYIQGGGSIKGHPS